MKVIQSYIPYQEPHTFTLERDYAYLIMLSSLLAKKHYGNVTLYTNETQKSLFEEIGFQYDEYNITVLENINDELWVLPKIMTCLSQDTPFIHIDLDTLLLDHIDIFSYKSPFVFSHPDISDNEIKIDKDIYSLFTNRDLYYLYEAYLSFYYQFNLDYEQPFEGIPLNLFELNKLPNMSFIGVSSNIHELKRSLLSTLDVYQLKEVEFDRNRRSAMLLEQLCFSLFLKKEIEPQKFDFLESVKNIRKLQVSDINNTNLKFFHIGGQYRNNPNFISSFIEKIVNEFDEGFVTCIFDFYKSRQRQTGNLIELTDGEKEYETKTKTNLFSKRIKSLL